MTTSPGVWPRSIAPDPSEISPGFAARRCISAFHRRFDRRAVEALEADHHQAAVALLVLTPGAVVVMLDPAADALQHQAHVAAGDVEEALHAQDVVLGDGRLQA